MRYLLPLAFIWLAPAAFAQQYQCNPTEECMNFPEPCTETAFKDEILMLDISEDMIAAEFEIYGSVNIPLLARNELEASTSFLLSTADLSVFATLYHTGELALLLPSDTGGGNPVLLRLICEEIQ